MTMIRFTRFRAGAIATCVTLAFSGWSAMAVPVAHAAPSLPYSVYVGYADSIHGSANFPSPWAGSPGVKFKGCLPVSSCVFDAGAVRVVNTSGGALTVNSIAVHFDTCTYDIWPHDKTVPASAQLIVTQNVTGDGNGRGCTGANSNPPFTVNDGTMDSSDIGPHGVSWSNNCTQSGIVPAIDVTVNGTTTTFSDDKQVLNTGGKDASSCGGPTNEGHGWALVPAPCPGAAVLTLTPPSQNAGIATSATVTATLTNACGTPLGNDTVTFNVTSGPNTGTSGTATTHAGGHARFTYSSAVVGTDTLSVSTTAGGGATSNNVTVTWWDKSVHCTAGVSCTTGPVTQSATTSQVTGTSSTDASLNLSLGVDTIDRDCDDDIGPLRGTDHVFSGAPQVTTFLATTFTSSSPKNVVLTIDKSAVTHPIASYEVCYATTTAFKDRFGHTGTIGYLPDCSAVANVAPCLVSKTSTNGNVVETFTVPGNDPHFH